MLFERQFQSKLKIGVRYSELINFRARQVVNEYSLILFIFALSYFNQQKRKYVSVIRPPTQGEHITGKPKGENEKRKSHSSFQTDLNTHLLCKVCKIYEPMYADEKYQAKK